MKCSILKENLYKGLLVVSSVAAKNLTLPILQNVRISASQGGIELATTNLEIGIRYTLRGKVDEPGEITVPARVAQEMASVFPNERVDCWTEGNTLHITCANTQTELRGISVEEFPVIPTLTQGEEVVCDAQECVDALNQTLFSVASDETRPEIHGMFVHAEGQELTFASTDSFRLGERMISATIDANQPITRIVPHRTLQELDRLITNTTNGPASVKLIFGENQLSLRCGDGEIISRLIEGKYPEYRQVIPESAKTTVSVSTKELLNLVKAASLFCRSGMNDVYLLFTPEDSTVRVKAANTQVGEYDATTSAQIVGDQNEITLNYRFLLDGLNAIKSDVVKLEMTEKQNPILLKPADAKRKYFHLIMPIKQ